MTQVAASPSPGAHPAPLEGSKSSSFADGIGLQLTLERDRVSIDSQSSGNRSSWRMHSDAGRLTLELEGEAPDGVQSAHVLAALEALYTRHPGVKAANLSCPRHAVADLLRSGLVRDSGAEGLTVTREALWQQPEIWRPTPAPPCPSQYVFSGDKRHPLRPPKATGVVYRRFIPWLGKTISFRTPDVAQDLPRFNTWMNDPVVAHFWQEEGDLAKHHAYLESIAQDPHITSLIGCFDDEPFAYFEVYFAKEDRIAPFYDARDFDRGWHVLVGEEKFRGAQYLTAWMPSLSHYLFLDDWRTDRIVIEPRSDNAKMLKSLARCGYALLKEFEFPHKRAVLGMLLRERFFADALWLPSSSGAAPTH